jgi:hypothetical protein
MRHGLPQPTSPPYARGHAADQQRIIAYLYPVKEVPRQDETLTRFLRSLAVRFRLLYHRSRGLFIPIPEGINFFILQPCGGKI